MSHQGLGGQVRLSHLQGKGHLNEPFRSRRVPRKKTPIDAIGDAKVFRYIPTCVRHYHTPAPPFLLTKQAEGGRQNDK